MAQGVIVCGRGEFTRQLRRVLYHKLDSGMVCEPGKATRGSSGQGFRAGVDNTVHPDRDRIGPGLAQGNSGAGPKIGVGLVWSANGTESPLDTRVFRCSRIASCFGDYCFVSNGDYRDDECVREGVSTGFLDACPLSGMGVLCHLSQCRILVDEPLIESVTRILRGKSFRVLRGLWLPPISS